MKYFLMTILIFSSNAVCQENDKALQYTAEAMLKTKKIKEITDHYSKRLERFAEKYVGKKLSASAVVITSMAIEGKIDTNKINYSFEPFNKINVKPYIVYDINNNETKSVITLQIKY